MTNQAAKTDEQRVKEVYPDAHQDAYSPAIWASDSRQTLLVIGKNWHDAASRLPKEESVPDDCLDITDDGKVHIAAHPAAPPVEEGEVTVLEPWKDDPETPDDRINASRMHLAFNGSNHEAAVRFSRDTVHARRMLLEACAISRRLSEEIVELRKQRDAWNAAKASSPVTFHPMKNASGMEVCKHCFKSNGEHNLEDKCLDNFGNRTGTSWMPLMVPFSSPVVAGGESETLVRVIKVLERAARFITKVDDLHQTIYSNGLDEDCEEAIALLKPFIKDVRGTE